MSRKFYVKLYTDLALATDLESAVILMRIVDWCNHHAESGHHTFLKEGKWWCWNSIHDLCEQLPYIKPTTAKRRLSDLVDSQWLFRGMFNRMRMDKTYWYSPNWDKLRPYMPEEVKPSYASKLTGKGLRDFEADEVYERNNRNPSYKLEEVEGRESNLQNRRDQIGPIVESNLDRSEVTVDRSEVSVTSPIPEINIHRSHSEKTYIDNSLPSSSMTPSPSAPGRDNSFDITLYEGHPSLKTSQKEQKGTARSSEVETPRKHRNPGKGAVSLSPEDLIIAKEWLRFALGEMKWKEPKGSWTEQKFAEEFAKIIRVTGINHSGLHALLAFVRKDDFWRPNALSPAGLLKKSANGNRKIDNILLKMKPKGQSKYEKALEAVAAMEREDKVKGKPGNDPF